MMKFRRRLTSGVGLVEVYDLDQEDDSKLATQLLDVIEMLAASGPDGVNDGTSPGVACLLWTVNTIGQTERDGGLPELVDGLQSWLSGQSGRVGTVDGRGV